jgi:hypothetical protein
MFLLFTFLHTISHMSDEHPNPAPLRCRLEVVSKEKTHPN